MIKIDFNKQFKKLNGADYEGDANHMGKFLAEVLSATNKGNAVKFYNWALKFYNKEVVEIDKPDYELLESWIENSEINNLCKAQLINELKEQKEKDSPASLKKAK